ncbi:MAG: DUF1588 domain-containing protein [Alphaproteobacteria bacterium]|nr:DUF1588 domain-containing protein [Alphaproteobacteria bacterium]
MVILLSLLIACDDTAPASHGVGPQMGAVKQLTRASLDLRGVRPSPEELAQVEADPSAVDGLIEGFMADDEAFGRRVRDLFAEHYRTRTEYYYISADAYGLADGPDFIRSMGEEPLRVLSRIATEDLPYSELVTGDWTMANETLERVWPLAREDGEGWQVAHYQDGRPPAGVLSTNAMWLRYTSTTSNANRARANAVSRILLCHDYLSRPIHFDRNVNLLDQEAVETALRSDPSCVNCHTSLDPLASYFFGFFHYDFYNPDEVSVYHPERELIWRDTTEVSPAFYGDPGYTLTDLGQQLAGDPRFVECAVEQVYEGLLRRDATLDDADALTRHREAFLDGGLTLRALFRSVVNDPDYTAGATDEAGRVPKKMLTPELLASSVEDITGFALTYQGYALMASDQVGYRTLAGGADGFNVTSSALSPNTTLLLVQERLAQQAAWFAAERDAAGPAELFTRINFTETPESGRDAMVAQIQDLHLRVLGTHVDADGPEVEANLALWQDLYEVEREQVDAWAGLLSVLLRDPDFLFY